MALPTEVQDLLDAGRSDVRGMIRFQFGTGTYGFIRSRVPLTYSGLTYVPGGIIEISDLTSGMGFDPRQFTVRLAGSPDEGLTPDVLQTIEQEDYRDRPVTIYDAHFHPDTNALLHVEPMERGLCDLITHTIDPELGYTLEMTCEERAIDYTRTNGRKRNTADQARRALGDLIFQHVARRGREDILFGRDKAS